MNLTKSAQLTYVPGTPATPAQIYSRTCPSAPPAASPNPSAGDSSGLKDNCYIVPVYETVYVAHQGWVTGVVGYDQVCH